MKKSVEERNDLQKNIRFPRNVHDALVAAAGARGISVTAYVVDTVREAARRDLQDVEARQRLLARLDSDGNDG